MAIPSEADRDARLDALSSALSAWSIQRTTYLNNQVAFCKRVLKGRTGAERLNAVTSTQANALTVDSLTQFLTGA
jgi:hypothetical protein